MRSAASEVLARRRWPVAVTLLVPIVMPFLVSQVRALVGHRASAAAHWALPLCEALLLIGLSGPLYALWSTARAGSRPHTAVDRPEDARAEIARGRHGKGAAVVCGAFGVVCLSGAITEAIRGSLRSSGGLTHPVDHRIAGGVLAVLGVVVLAGVVLWDRHGRAERDLRQRRLAALAPPMPGPPPTAAPPSAGGPGLRGVDGMWWAGAVVGIAVTLLWVLVPPDGIVPRLRGDVGAAGTDGSPWPLGVHIVIALAWIAVVVAYLRTPRDVTNWPDPRDQLDPVERRNLARSIRDDHPVDPALRPVLRAHLVRELHHGRRGTWTCVALGLQALDAGVTDLAHHPAAHADATARIAIGSLGLLVVPFVLRHRRRAARQLAALDHPP